MTIFIRSQFGYYALVWMLLSIQINNHRNSTQKRVFGVVCRDNNEKFHDLVRKDKLVKAHQRNSQRLAT